MQRVALALLPLYALVAAIPNPSVAAPSSLDGSDPSGSDPTSPPQSISFPTAIPNPYPSGIPTQPGQCDGQNPSSDCFDAMGQSGGYLWFDKDSQCTDSQKSAVNTAIWDASSLASYSSQFPNSGQRTHSRASAIFYMGPDFATQQTRIAGNLKRASQFKTSETSEKEYITVSCKDTKNLGGRRVEGKGRGRLCVDVQRLVVVLPLHHPLPRPFFTIDSLDTKIHQVFACARQPRHNNGHGTWLG